MNDYVCKEFCKYILNIFRVDFIDFLSIVKFIFIMVDGVIDVLCLEEEIVYVRFVLGGVLKMCYVELVEVESVKVLGILKVIKFDMDKIYL